MLNLRLVCLSFLVPFVFTPAALRGQAFAEVTSLQNATSVIDFDQLPAGPLTLAQINAAGTNGGAGLRRLDLLPEGAAPGTYDTNTAEGRALALDPSGSGLIAVDVAGAYGSFEIDIELPGPSTEFGFVMADFDGPAQLIVFDGNQEITGTTTTPFLSGALRKSFRFFPGGGFTTFDRVAILLPGRGGNFTLPLLEIEQPSGAFSFGEGCTGNLTLAPLTLGTGASTVTSPGGSVEFIGSNLAPSATGFLLFAGGDDELLQFTIPLPLDLGPFGATGCSLLTSSEASVVAPVAGGTGSFTLPIPNTPSLIGARAFFQAAAFDTNPLGFVTSNGLQIILR